MHPNCRCSLAPNLFGEKQEIENKPVDDPEVVDMTTTDSVPPEDKDNKESSDDTPSLGHEVDIGSDSPTEDNPVNYRELEP